MAALYTMGGGNREALYTLSLCGTICKAAEANTNHPASLSELQLRHLTLAQIYRF